MKVKQINGDLTKSGANVVAQQVNCLGGAGGLAYAMRLTFPKEYNEYIKLVRSNTGKSSDLLGTCQLVQIDSEHYVANLFGQDGYASAEQPCATNYDALKEALVSLKNKIAGNETIKRVAFPWLMSCGLAGGDWNIVKPLVENVFNDMDISLEWWKY